RRPERDGDVATRARTQRGGAVVGLRKITGRVDSAHRQAAAAVVAQVKELADGLARLRCAEGQVAHVRSAAEGRTIRREEHGYRRGCRAELGEEAGGADGSAADLQ